MKKIILNKWVNNFSWNMNEIEKAFNELLDILAEEGIIELEEDNIKEIEETEEA